MGKDKHQKDRRERTPNDALAWTVAVAGLKGSYTQSYRPDAGTPHLDDMPDVSTQEFTNLGYDPARFGDLMGPSAQMLRTSPPKREIWGH